MLKKVVGLSFLLGWLTPCCVGSDVFSEFPSWYRAETMTRKDLFFRALKTGMVVSGALNVLEKGDRKSILVNTLLSSAMILTRDSLEKTEGFSHTFLNRFFKFEKKTPYLCGPTMGIVSGLLAQHLFKDKKWASWFGVLTGISCGITEILFGDKVSLYHTFTKSYIKSKNKLSVIDQEMNPIWTQVKDAVKTVIKQECTNLALNIWALKGKGEEVFWDEAAEESQNLIKMNRDQFKLYAQDFFKSFSWLSKRGLDTRKITQWCVTQYPDSPETFQTEEELQSFLINKFVTLKKVYDGWDDINIDRSKSVEIARKDLVKLIQLKTGKDESDVLGLVEFFENVEGQLAIDAAIKTVQACDWSTTDWKKVNTEIVALQEIKKLKTSLQSLQKQYETTLKIKSVGALFGNIMNFVMPVFALSFLSEKIRGNNKDLLAVMFLTVLADALKEKALSAAVISAAAFNVSSLATGMQTKTAYRFLKSRFSNKQN